MPSPVIPQHTEARRVPKSTARKTVETVLRRFTPESPVTAVQLAVRCDLAPEVVRNCITAIVNMGLAHNTCPGERPGLYAWGPPVIPKTPPPRFVPEGDYAGEELRPFTGRHGADHAYQLPSIHNGATVPRTRPMLMGASMERSR
jgi:hypothetical protein